MVESGLNAVHCKPVRMRLTTAMACYSHSIVAGGLELTS